MTDVEFILRSALAQRDAEIERLRAALEDVTPELDAIAASEWKCPIDLYAVNVVRATAANLANRAREALRPAGEHHD